MKIFLSFAFVIFLFMPISFHAQMTDGYTANNFLQLMRKIDEKERTHGFPLSNKKTSSNYNKVRKKLLSKDTCDMIFKADTIHVLLGYPNYGRGSWGLGFNEAIVGNGIWLNYSFKNKDLKYKKFIKETLERIIQGNYQEIEFDFQYPFGSHKNTIYFLITHSSNGRYKCEKKYFVYEGLYKDRLCVVPDWEE